MRSRNPFLGKNFQSQAGLISDTGRMTVAGTINKVLLLGALIIAGALVDVAVYLSNPGIALGAGILAMIVALGFSIAISFKPEWAPTAAPIYALVEGLALGALSILFGAQSMGIVPGAIMLTVTIFIVMFGCYKLGILRATPRFVAVVSFATMGIFLTYLISFGLSFLGIRAGFLYSPSLLSIGLSLLFAGVAALNLIIDFDFIERGSQQGMPKYMEWYGAFALTVTLVWLYLEMLRLLSNLSRR